MRKKHWLALLLMAGCGCSSMNNTEKDAVGGAAAGTLAGAALTRGNPAGMVIGGLLGTGVGAAIGSNQDRADAQQKAIAQAQANAAANAARNQMSLDDVVQLVQRNTPEDIIIRQIDATGSVFSLTTSDIFYLQDHGVSRNIIGAMQARRYPRPVAVGPGPVYGPPPGTVVIVDPGPPPPPIGLGVGIGVGGHFR